MVMRLCRYEGWAVVRTLSVRESRMYLMHLGILSQCREHRMGDK